MNGISDNYHELTLNELPVFAERVRNAWQDAAIPERQWNRVVKGELDAFRRGQHVRPYDVLISCMKMLPSWIRVIASTSLVDIGAASGYYKEVLRIGGFTPVYVAVDESEAFMEWAQLQFPGIHFAIANAANLNDFTDESANIVLHSACIMHCAEWKKAIKEAARIAKDFVIFHRTPIADKTTYFAKSAYGVECLEIHFNQDELFEHFHAAGLKLIGFEKMGTDMKSFVMAKTKE